MHRLAPELLLLIFRQLCDEKTASIKTLASISECCTQFRDLAIPLLYRSLSPSALNSPLLLRTFRHQPRYASHVRYITWTLGPTQSALAHCLKLVKPSNDAKEASAIHYAHNALDVLKHCGGIVQMDLILAPSPANSGMPARLAEELISLPMVMSLKVLAIATLGNERPVIANLYEFLCHCIQLEKVFIKGCRLPHTLECWSPTRLPAPALKRAHLFFHDPLDAGILSHLLYSSRQTLTELTIGAVSLCPASLFSAICIPDRPRFPNCKLLRLGGFAMANYQILDWIILLNTFPAVERLWLSFTQQSGIDLAFLTPLAHALLESRNGLTIKELAIQTDSSFRAGPFLPIFQIAKYCPELVCLWPQTNGFSELELTALAGQAKLPVQNRDLGTFCRNFVKAEVSLLDDWSKQFNLAWKLRVLESVGAKEGFSVLSSLPARKQFRGHCA